MLADASEPPAAGGARRWLSFVHTNDIHGAFDLRPATWLEGQPPVGGFQALSGFVEAARALGPTVLLDAGDLMSGNPLTVIDFEGTTGGAAMALMNAVGYDAMALGNHEFDNGRAELEALVAAAAFPVLSANLRQDWSKQLLLPASTVLERGGVSIGVVGVILEDLAGVVDRDLIRGLVVEDAVMALEREVARLDPVTDLLVVVAHAGLEECRALAAAVEGIDVIFAGHDHRRTQTPWIERGVLIVEAGSSLTNAGQLQVEVWGDRILDYRYDLVVLEEGLAAQAAPAVLSLTERARALVDAEYGVELATLKQPLTRDYKAESPAGNWVTDAMRQAAQTDFAVTNGSGLRSDVLAGVLTRLDLHNLYPFRNLLSTFECTGSQLLVLAAHNAQRALGADGSVVQVSGLSYAFLADGTIQELMVAGEPVELARTYTGATSDFLLFSQAEKYLGFVPAVRHRRTELVSDVLVLQARAQGTIDATVEGRMRRVESGAPLDKDVRAPAP